MKIKKYIYSLVAVSLFINNSLINSMANERIFSSRYEDFNNDYITVRDNTQSKGAKIEIEGNTLTNIAPKLDSGAFIFNGGSVTNGIYTSNENVQWSGIHQVKNLDLFKPDTDYTISFNITSNTHGGNLYLANHSAGVDGVFYDEGTIPAGTTGTVKVKLRTKPDLSSVGKGLILFGGTETGTFSISEIMIIEGDYVNKSVPYFEGIKSGGNVNQDSSSSKPYRLNITNSNKNLDAGGEVSGNYYAYYSGKLANDNSNVNSHIAPVKPNTTYTFKNHNSNLTFWDKDFNFLGGLPQFTTITTPANCAYVRYAVSKKDTDIIQVEESSSSTDLEASLNNSNEILLNEPLRGIPGGVKDRIVKKDGKWYVERNLNEVILDGSENWTGLNIGYYEKQNIGFASFEFNDAKVTKRDSVTMTSDKFKGIPYNDTYNNVTKGTEGVSAGRSGVDRLYIFIDTNRLSTPDYNGLVAWLRDNPVRVVYETATPRYEPLNISSSLSLYQGDNHIYNDSFVPLNMYTTIDRIINIATDAVNKSKIDSTLENISYARLWVNEIDDSMIKDHLQSELNVLFATDVGVVERKTITANTDMYIISKNALSVSINTNSIMFEEVDGTEDVEKKNALELTIQSSLPYSLKASLESNISNSDGSEILSPNVLNIKTNHDISYNAFSGVGNEIVLIDNHVSGQSNLHKIDMRIKSTLIKRADTYKGTIRFKVEQK